MFLIGLREALVATAAAAGRASGRLDRVGHAARAYSMYVTAVNVTKSSFASTKKRSPALAPGP